MPPAFVLSQDQTLRKNYFHHSLHSSWSFFAKKICDSSDMYNCTNLLFFYYDFSSFIQNFQNLTRAHRTIQFFKEHADKHKKNISNENPSIFIRASVISSTFQHCKMRFRHLLFFRPIVTSDLLFANSCRSWCCLMYHQSRICQTLFSKKFNFFLKFFTHPAWSKHKISFNDIEFKTSYICINKLLFKTPLKKTTGLKKHNQKWICR